MGSWELVDGIIHVGNMANGAQVKRAVTGDVAKDLASKCHIEISRTSAGTLAEGPIFVT